MSKDSITASACRAARARAGLKQAELAEMAGMDRSTLVRIEAGHNTSVARIEAIAGALGMSLSELLRYGEAA